MVDTINPMTLEAPVVISTLDQRLPNARLIVEGRFTTATIDDTAKTITLASTLPLPSTAKKLMVSDGTNWISSQVLTKGTAILAGGTVDVVDATLGATDQIHWSQTTGSPEAMVITKNAGVGFTFTSENNMSTAHVDWLKVV